MICEICREAAATVHLTEIVNNNKKEIHLCEACAQQKGVAIHAHVKNLSIPEFFGHLVESKAVPDETQAEISCHGCGITYAQFRSSGKFGCPLDYQVFRAEVEELLEKFHGGVQHRGKVPRQVSREVTRVKEIEELRVELKRAVEREEYEHAAELRDRIHELEREEQCS